MPLSFRLKGVAAGLAGSFVGRNNDVEGYWGIGLLCRDAAHTRGKVLLDLGEGLSSPATPSCVHMTKTYAEYLEKLLDNVGFSPGALAGAEICVEFGQASQTHANEVGFTCTVSLTDNKRRRHEVVTRGQCWPHNPARESRRAHGSVP